MSLLLNNAEGGVLGATVTTANSGGASGQAWDTVSLTAGKGTLIYDSTNVANGSLAYKIATPATAASVDILWGSQTVTGVNGGTVLTLWQRGSFFFSSIPATSHRLMSAASNSSQICGAFVLGTSGKIIIQDSGSHNILTTSSTIPTNQWFRIEGFFTGTATTGQAELKLFQRHTDTVPVETITTPGTLNTINSGAGISQARYGNETGTPVANMLFWADDLGASTTGYIGPATLSVAASDAASFSEASRYTAAVNASDSGGFTENTLLIIGALGLVSVGDSAASISIQNKITQPVSVTNQQTGSVSIRSQA